VGQGKFVKHQTCTIPNRFTGAEIFHCLNDQTSSLADRFIDYFSLGTVSDFSDLFYTSGNFSIVSVQTDRWNDEIDQSKKSTELNFSREGVTKHSMINPAMQVPVMRMDQVAYS